MQATPDGTSTGEGGLDPREAAMLLERTKREARRKLELTSPWLSLLGAAVVLVALGAVWLSVREQHPYKGPTAGGLLVMYGLLICWIVTVVTFQRRRMSGVSGATVRQQRAFAAVTVAALVGVSVFQGILKSDGVSLGVVYGTYPLTAQLIVLGSIGAVMASAREEWPGFGIALAIILVATGSAFAGPRGVWLGNGIGCAVVVLGHAAAQAWLHRRSVGA